MISIDEIDRAVDQAVGVTPKPSAPKQPAPKQPPPIRTNNPGALMPGGKLAQFSTMEEGLQALDKNLANYGRKGINTLERVISTWAPPNENDTKAYIAHAARVTGLKPNQQIDLSNPLVRHQISAAITQMESGRNAIYGQPFRVDVSGVGQPEGEFARSQDQTPSQQAVTKFMAPEAIDAAVDKALATPEKQGAVASRVQSLLRGTAGLADTLAGVVPSVAGMATYAGARAMGQTPEEAEATKERVTQPLAQPFGRAFGVTETPEYQAEATQRLMGFIGENVQKGANWIAEKTGLSKQDAQYYMELAMSAAPFSKRLQTEAGYAAEAAKKGAGAVVEAAKGVTPPVVQRGVTRAVEAVAPGTTKPVAVPPTLGQQPGVQPAAAPVAPGRGSVGAMATPDAAMIQQALTTATPEFQALYGNMPINKINTPVVLRHLEADSLPVPVRLTEGQATGNVRLLSEEQNLRGAQPELANRFNEQNKQLMDNVPLIRERAAPDVYATRTIESSEAIIDAYKAIDEARNTKIREAYKALENAAGGEFPVDGAAIARNANAVLAKKLKSEFVPTAIKNQLQRFADGEPMTFENFEAMRTNLAAEIRKAKRNGDGNAAQASSIVRDALENLPLKGKVGNLKGLADQARKLAKERFDALAKDPAYAAAVDDAVAADKFFDKFVINGVNKNINTMVGTLGRDSVAHQHMKAGAINWLSDKAGMTERGGNFSQANYNKAVKKLDDARNFQAIFDPESQLQLKTLGNVAAYTQFQPRGSFVNNSNTLVGYLANRAAGVAEQAGNVAGLKFAGGVPLGSMVRQRVQASKEQSRAKQALEPGAGSTLSDISKGQ